METEDENYDVSETAIRDHSMLGAHGEKLCNNLDVHWMVKTCGSPKDETGKCVCVCVCVCVLCGPFTPSECLLSYRLAVQLYPAGCKQDSGNCRFFASGSAHVRNFRNVSRQQSGQTRHLWVYPDIYGFPSTAQTSVVDNWTTGLMVHFWYYKKEVLVVWPGVAHSDRGETESTSVCRARTGPANFHPDRSTYHIGEWRRRKVKRL